MDNCYEFSIEGYTTRGLHCKFAYHSRQKNIEEGKRKKETEVLMDSQYAGVELGVA